MNNFYRCLSRWNAFFEEWLKSDAGVTSIEYALIGLLIAVVIVGAVTTVGTELLATYEYVAGCLVDPSSCI